MTMRIMNGTKRRIRKPLTAEDVMAPNPKSIGQKATVRETAEFMQKHGIHVAPVIDTAGRPVGVVSRTDLLEYWSRRHEPGAAREVRNLYDKSSETKLPGDELTVRDIMTPFVIDVQRCTPIGAVIQKILALEVRSLFVTDEHGVLIGTVSVFELLRHAVEHGAMGTEAPVLASAAATGSP